MATQFTALGFSKPEAIEQVFLTQPKLLDLNGAAYALFDAGGHASVIASLHPETGDILDWDIHFASDNRLIMSVDEILSADEMEQSMTAMTIIQGMEKGKELLVSFPITPMNGMDGSLFAVQPCFYCEKAAFSEMVVEGIDCDGEKNRIAGEVVFSEVQDNKLTGEAYIHMIVDVGGLLMDAVCEKAMFEKQPFITAVGPITAVSNVLN